MMAGCRTGSSSTEEEKTEFTVVLAEVGAQKIKVIKAVKNSNRS